MRNRAIRVLLPSLLAGWGLAAVACGGGQAPPKEPMITETVADAGPPPEPEPPAPPKSLFERLGGKDGLTKIVDSLVANINGDSKLSKRFAKVKGDRLEKFKATLVEQLCEATGGDCQYAGKSMKDAHKGMKIKDDEWNAFLIDFKKALDEHEVADEEQQDLMSLLAPMHDDIVEAKKK